MSTSLFETRHPPTPGTLEPGGHGVEFYGYDAEIMRKVADFLSPGLDSGEAAIVIATPQHRNALLGELESRGVAVRWVRQNGRVQMYDAASSLSKLLVGDGPDAARFEELVGGLIAKAQATGADHVRAYGEMVALLWLAGRPQAALSLERLWNDLAQKLSFTLLCGYPIHAFGPQQADQIAEIGRTHTQIAPLQRTVGALRV